MQSRTATYSSIGHGIGHGRAASMTTQDDQKRCAECGAIKDPDDQRDWGYGFDFAKVRKLSSGRYGVRYTLPNGRRISAGRSFAHRRDAEAWAADRARQIDR